MGKLGNKTVIAMKGHSFTRKTEFANLIASSLKCPVLSLHDILDFLSPDHEQDVAFGIITQIAKSNLSAGLLENVVIDSPLSSRTHLDQLIQLAESLDQSRLLILECKPNNIYAWQMKFEEHLDFKPDETSDKWYKAKNWEDVEKEIRAGYDERLDGYKVSKLVLDPISDYLDSSPASVQTRPFLDAVTYMITRNEDDGPDVVEYHRWRQGQYLPPDSIPSNYGKEESGQICFYFCGTEPCTQTGSCRGGSGHYITNYTEELGLYHKAECRACDKQVIGGAYTCKYCSFILHKECAELLDDTNKAQRDTFAPDYGFDSLSTDWNHPLYPDRFYCSLSSCQDDFPLSLSKSSCGDCLFTTHLKNRLMPTVIRHECDNEHFLSIVLSLLNPNEEYYQCRACGGSVDSLWYSCRICSVAYHYKCLVDVPRCVEHEHGCHHHHMLLQYSSEEAEDYLCRVCFENGDPERRDPNRWYYSCGECEYHAHLRCVYDSSKE